ncbi:CGNR zinc finger domain-containing protein [Streptomyces sp. FXJ1.172]|uniref:CGNR zinc finger domain-containing protein n=1 Tax=Streptomyces sp. FXJ1.172 TaxID=710705 RepID=UPI0007D009FB|nr:CGNR zinc finger domain-containing protein [Streptomyces sp. FXJ1.172]WEO92948.1 CGNR zinc finger domain-containing protein [Streptomyces sp. FXJ1.172]
MRYVDYIGNLTRLAVEIVNGDDPSELRREMFCQHRIAEPDPEQLGEFLPRLLRAVEAASQGGPLAPVNALLEQHPPLIRVDDHNGEGSPHLHFAPNGENPVHWLGRSCSAALAHVVCGDPAVTIGRCHATDCERFYVDDSRNRTRRFCSNACASRTTVAAYRARRKAGH